ncbi:MAG: hypothetical protein M3474_03740 [Actinomycetota bacterium]|nr:hypothetical protein [Actinomycetota bacterium]
MIVGLGGADRVRGGGGDDVLCGGNGDDKLRGGAGDDRMFGGHDARRGQNDTQADFLSGGRGADRMVGGNDGGNDHVSYRLSKRAVSVDLDAESASGQGSDKVIGIEWVTGTDFGDVLRAGQTKDKNKYKGITFRGLDGPDRLVGWRDGNAVRLYGGPGKDVVLAASNDRGFGDAGADVMRSLRAPGCDDSLSGGCVDLVGGDGDDVIRGSSGDDSLSGGYAPDTGRDIIRGMAGRDFIEGGPGRDDLFGGSGRDYLLGEDGRDKAYGGDGVDHCDAEVMRSCEKPYS